MKEKKDKSNDTTVNKFEEISKEINKMNKEILNKKFESIKVKDNTIFEELKKYINEFIDSSNKEVDAIKNNL